MPVWPRFSVQDAARTPGGPIVGEVVVWQCQPLRHRPLDSGPSSAATAERAPLADLETGDPRCLLCRQSNGSAHAVHLTHGVSVWLCERHSSDGYLSRSDGDAFAERVASAWISAGSLTRRRVAALNAHRRRVRERRSGRPLPGSYSWPELRRSAEERFAAGEDPADVIRDLRERYAAGPARPPTTRTMRRWFSQARWRPTPRRTVRHPATGQRYREIRRKPWRYQLTPWMIARHMPGAEVRYVKWPPEADGDP